MSTADKPTTVNKEFVNPFKTDEQENPGVDIHKSRKRSEQKLNQLRPAQSRINKK